ncbi:hydroxyphenylacetyl-CoA thioesterase PaaI [Candidatus Obscuribacterales bacterium]|nr:hydroxyphenylacetyl-CoA thioesterase PaaI [Candidatus Obscuribacterales bacterium]
MDTLTPKELAHKVAEEMFRNDKASKHLGMRLDAIDEGTASVSMTVRDDMLNGFGICHGGVTFTLADTAFACACNSRNRKTVALNCTISFLAAGKVGDVLTATAREVSLAGRTGLYDIRITNQTGAVMAEFRGTSYGTSSKAID